MSFTVQLFDTEKEAIAFCVQHFYTTAQDAIAKRGCFAVALSGGSTPKALYNALLHSSLVTSIDWRKAFVFWGDERAVAPDDPESNWAMAMQFFGKEPLSFAKKFRMEADTKDLDHAARKYEEHLALCPDRRLDLVYLGMGDDGHVASLFPGTEALKETERLVVPNFVPAKGGWRMTFTYPCINRAREVLILVFGQKKSTTLHEVLKGAKERYPITRVARPEARIICDRAAFTFHV